MRDGMRDPRALAALNHFVARHPRLFVLTGAGISTRSGIPCYRNAEGRWQRAQPVTHQAFVGSSRTRQRYWSRSLVGWPHVANALPNPAHRVLARLERDGRIERLVTQNVDGLHQRAGSRAVIDLHGRIDEVVCLGCGALHARSLVQSAMVAANPHLVACIGAVAPDGDAEVDGDDAAFVPPECPACGGLLKPNVVFYGANVPRARVDEAMAALAAADALLVVGSSLMVWSAFRFCDRAHALGKPIAAINRGRTRADALLALKVEDDCCDALAAIAGIG